MATELQFLVPDGNGEVLLEAVLEPFDAIAFAVGGAIQAHDRVRLDRDAYHKRNRLEKDSGHRNHL